MFFPFALLIGSPRCNANMTEVFSKFTIQIKQIEIPQKGSERNNCKIYQPRKVEKISLVKKRIFTLNETTPKQSGLLTL